MFLPGSTSSCSHRVGRRRGTQGTLEETPRAKIDSFLYKEAGSKPELSPDFSLRGKHRARGSSAVPLRNNDCVSELPKPSQLHSVIKCKYSFGSGQPRVSPFWQQRFCTGFFPALTPCSDQALNGTWRLNSRHLFFMFGQGIKRQ